MTQYFGVLKIQSGKRNEYIKALTESCLEEKFRKQSGNVYYYISESITDADVITVIDAWESHDAFDAHCNSPEVVGMWNELVKQFVDKELKSFICDIE